jgi:hypothetical protein
MNWQTTVNGTSGVVRWDMSAFGSYSPLIFEVSLGQVDVNIGPVGKRWLMSAEQSEKGGYCSKNGVFGSSAEIKASYFLVECNTSRCRRAEWMLALAVSRSWRFQVGAWHGGSPDPMGSTDGRPSKWDPGTGTGRLAAGPPFASLFCQPPMTPPPVTN